VSQEPYNYNIIAQQPKLLAFYAGWLGQKAYALAYSAVLRDRHELWANAAGEVDRLLLLAHEAAKLKHVDLSGDVGLALSELLARFSSGCQGLSSAFRTHQNTLITAASLRALNASGPR